MTQQEQIYKIAAELATSKRAVDIKRAMDLFESLGEYKEAVVQANVCKKRLSQLAHYHDYMGIPVRNQKSVIPMIRILACLVVACITGGIVAAAMLGSNENLSVAPAYGDVQLANPTASPKANSLIPMVSPTEERLPTLPPTASTFPTGTLLPVRTAMATASHWSIKLQT